MFRIIQLTVILNLFLTGACTSESKLKKLALAEAKTSFESKIANEARRVRDSAQLREAFKTTVFDRTTYSITDLRSEDHKGEVSIRVETVPYQARRVLVDLLDRTKANTYSFNVPDALRLVREQLKIKNEVEIEATYRMGFEKKNGDWKLVSFRD